MRDRAKVIEELGAEAGLGKEDAELYLKMLEEGSAPSGMAKKAARLSEKGMVILSGDGRRLVPVHPRLGVANQYRTWREGVVREINERRLRVDRLILELIPLYEAAMEKRAESEGRGKTHG